MPRPGRLVPRSSGSMLPTRLAGCVLLLSLSGCGDCDGEPAWVAEADIHRIVIVPRYVSLSEHAKVELRARLYDEDGHILPEYVRHPVTGKELERPDLTLTWKVGEGEEPYLKSIRLDSIGPTHHRALLWGPGSVPNRLEVKLSATANRKTGSATVIIERTGGKQDLLQLPVDSFPTVGLIDAPGIVDSLVAAVGQAQLDMDGEGNLTLLMGDRRPHHQTVQWQGSAVVKQHEPPTNDMIYVKAWIAKQGMSSEDEQFWMAQASRDLALANSVLADARTGLRLDLIGDVVLLPDFSTYESLHTGHGFKRWRDEPYSLPAFPEYPLTCAKRDSFPVAPFGPDFRLHVLHVLYVKEGGYRAEACRHVDGLGATAIIYRDNTSPERLVHELGHILSLDDTDELEGMVRVPTGIQRINVMWDNSGDFALGANSTHFTLGQAAKATLHPESFVWGAKEPPTYDSQPIRGELLPPEMVLPDVKLELVKDPEGVGQ